MKIPLPITAPMTMETQAQDPNFLSSAANGIKQTRIYAGKIKELLTLTDSFFN
jgi:hypothetical protein